MLTSNQPKKKEGCPHAVLPVWAAILLLSILFRLAAVFRLSIPLLYALVVPTLFSGWYYSHYTLANAIWYVMLAVTLLSRVYSLWCGRSLRRWNTAGMRRPKRKS